MKIVCNKCKKEIGVGEAYNLHSDEHRYCVPCFKIITEKKEQALPKFYSHLTMAQKKKLRTQLDAVSENKKRQLELFEKNFIKPLKEQIALVEKVKKSEISIQYYVQANTKWSEWLHKFMKNVVGGMNDEQGKDKKTN